MTSNIKETTQSCLVDFQSLIDFFQAFTKEDIMLVAPYITLIISVVIAVWGYRNGFKLQSENYRKEFQIKTYERFQELINNTNKPRQETAKAITATNRLLKSSKTGTDELYSSAIKESDTNSIFQQTKRDLLVFLKSVHIVEPRLDIFHELLSTNTTKFSDEIKLRCTLISEDKPVELKFHKESSINVPFHKLLLREEAILRDLQKDLQNILLSEIFNKKVNKQTLISSIEDYKIVIDEKGNSKPEKIHAK
jgi:hypothetical protein